MKTNNMIRVALKAFTFVALAFGITNCNKSNDNGVQPLNNGYRLVNNVCYQVINGVNTPIANTTCTQMNAPMYQMGSNGICYQILNGQSIQQQNQLPCSTTTAPGYGGTGTCAPQMINGQYVQQPNCGTVPNGGYGTNGTYGTVTQVCNGSYYHPSMGNINCGTDYYCQGPGFTNQYGQQVYCQ